VKADPIWTPSPERIARANVSRFIERLAHRGVPVGDWWSLLDWSLADPAEFWTALWEFTGVVAEDRAAGRPWIEPVRGLDRMAPPDPGRGPAWFTGARLNFAENLLRHGDAADAIVFWNEEGRQAGLSHAELARESHAFASLLAAAGVSPGDRVAGYLPNLPEAVIAMLGASLIGAVWSSCSPDFGAGGVLDRFGQIAPKVLVVADGYRYAGKEIDVLGRAADVVRQLPSVELVVVVPYRGSAPDLSAVPNGVLWGAALEPHRGRTVVPLRLPFDHPLYIMYSSGTTGLPKCMVHGAGGTLLQHLKELVLHTDLGRNDRIFYFTTCGWMMWNWLVSSLAVGATVILYDGAPLSPEREILWRMAEAEGVTVFGTSAKYLALAEKEGLAPGLAFDLSTLRTVLSTGSPLAAHSYDYVYRAIGRDVHLASISGGTDIISCFALGNPVGPVWRGELQTRGLGMRVEILEPAGSEEARDERRLPRRLPPGVAGELCCTLPFPSMPVAFWNDPDGARYRAAYFDVYPNTWRHGDWAELTEHGGLIIHGRSDATLNPGGVRIGTAEIYRRVEQMPEVVESLVVGQEWEGDVRIVLFVRLREGLALDDPLRERIRRTIRDTTSPHHVPRRIVQVADIPRTISGKITELAVREVIHGRPVTNRDALANPAALDLYRDLEELRS
jgi:acetoacetyl-CoA synthetase